MTIFYSPQHRPALKPEEIEWETYEELVTLLIDAALGDDWRRTLWPEVSLQYLEDLRTEFNAQIKKVKKDLKQRVERQ